MFGKEEVAKDPAVGSPAATSTTQMSLQSECTSSFPSQRRVDSAFAAAAGPQDKAKAKKPKWLRQASDWFRTSEPSLQSWKDHKKQVFESNGVSMNDPEAQFKLAATYGSIPTDAVKAVGGPSPEKKARKRTEQKKKMPDGLARTSPPSSQSGSGLSGSGSSRAQSEFEPWPYGVDQGPRRSAAS